MTDIRPFQMNCNMFKSESRIFTPRSIISIWSSNSFLAKIMASITEVTTLMAVEYKKYRFPNLFPSHCDTSSLIQKVYRQIQYNLSVVRSQ